MSLISISDIPKIKPDKLAILVREKNPSLAVVDVRDSDYIGGHILGGTNVPTHTHDYKIPELVRTLKDKETVVFHCALSQQRGPSSALKYLRERQRVLDAHPGKKDEGAGEAPAVKGQMVYVLEGGFVKWQEAYVKSDLFMLQYTDVILLDMEKTRTLPKATRKTYGSSATRN